MNLTFRKMEPDDINNCALSLMETFKEEPWNENWTYEQAYSRIEEIMSAPVSRGFVACADTAIVSMLCGRIMTYLDFKELWVDEFSVNPAFQRLGIGSKMLDFVRREVEKEGISYLSLTTDKRYPSALFYEKNGFHVEENVVFMAKKVAD